MMNQDIKDKILQSNTSLVGIVCKDGVVLGSDKRVTAGTLVVDKKYKKIMNVGEYTVAYTGRLLTYTSN